MTTTDTARKQGRECFKRFRGTVGTCPYSSPELNAAWWEGFHEAKNKRPVATPKIHEPEGWRPHKQTKEITRSVFGDAGLHRRKRKKLRTSRAV